MRHRLLGRTGLRVSEVFLGAMRFGAGQGGTPVDECRRIVDLYEDAGGNVIDTASAYGGSETVLGEILEGRRDRLVVATKYSLSRDRADSNAAGNHRKNLRLSLEASLRRLRTDYVDLLWVHQWDRHTPVEETMRALDDAVRAGTVLYVGISNAPAWLVARANTLAEWRDWSPFAGIQVPYHLLQRDIERELLPMAQALHLSVAAFAPLAHGQLSGRLAQPGTAATETTDARTLHLAGLVQQIADECGATPAQVAVAWTRTRSPLIHPLLGARRAEQLRDTLGAIDLSLTDDALHRLDAATQPDLGYPSDTLNATVPEVFGERFAELDHT